MFSDCFVFLLILSLSIPFKVSRDLSEWIRGVFSYPKMKHSYIFISEITEEEDVIVIEDFLE